ncbi:MAG: hypothetical protein JKY66_07345 [Spongiibacteraceae bacterium]|nr:hypothetical protein [Spongiibacteraceae bacterium]
MADEEENNNDSATPAEPPLSKIEHQAKTNRLIMICVGVLCGVLFCVMATGLTVMFMRISALNEAAEAETEDPMEAQFIGLEQQLLILSNFRKKELKKITAYTKQLNQIRNDCSIEKAAPYTKYLMEREVDFQKLIATIKSGTSSLAGMNKGSRKWVAPYKKSLESLKQKSANRKKNLATLIASSKSKK